MRPLVLALVLTSSSGTGTSNAAAPAALAGCQVGDEGTNSYSMLCPGALLGVTNREPGRSSEFVRGIVSGFASAAPQPVDRQSS